MRKSARSSTDRAPDFESVGWGFKSLRARQFYRDFLTAAQNRQTYRLTRLCLLQTVQHRPGVDAPYRLLGNPVALQENRLRRPLNSRMRHLTENTAQPIVNGVHACSTNSFGGLSYGIGSDAAGDEVRVCLGRFGLLDDA
jgi:hypothetical protein